MILIMAVALRTRLNCSTPAATLSRATRIILVWCCSAVPPLSSIVSLLEVLELELLLFIFDHMVVVDATKLWRLSM